MRPHREAFLDVLPTAAAALRREARGDSDHHMTGSFSLIREDVEKRAPTRVVNAFGEMVVPHHPNDVQVFYADTTVPRCILLGRREMKVSSLASDLEMLDRDFPVGFAAAVTAFFATAYGTLRLGETFLPPTIMARILDYAALGVGQKDLQADIQANGWMFARYLPRLPRLPRMHIAPFVL
jgi:hypothetical protein